MKKKKEVVAFVLIDKWQNPKEICLTESEAKAYNEIWKECEIKEVKVIIP